MDILQQVNPPVEIETRANPLYKIIYHATALLWAMIQDIDQGPESSEGEKEKQWLIKAIEQVNRIIYKQECWVAEDASPVDTSETPTSENRSPKGQQLRLVSISSSLRSINSFPGTL